MGRLLQLIRHSSVIRVLVHHQEILSQLATRSVGVGMYQSLMGTFSCHVPILMFRSSFGGASSSLNSVSFRTTHMEDPWILPPPSPSIEPIRNDVPFPTMMVAYQEKLDQVVDPSPFSSWTEEEDPYVLPA